MPLFYLNLLTQDVASVRPEYIPPIVAGRTKLGRGILDAFIPEESVFGA